MSNAQSVCLSRSSRRRPGPRAIRMFSQYLFRMLAKQMRAAQLRFTFKDRGNNRASLDPVLPKIVGGWADYFDVMQDALNLVPSGSWPNGTKLRKFGLNERIAKVGTPYSSSRRMSGSHVTNSALSERDAGLHRHERSQSFASAKAGRNERSFKNGSSAYHQCHLPMINHFIMVPFSSDTSQNPQFSSSFKWVRLSRLRDTGANV